MELPQFFIFEKYIINYVKRITVYRIRKDDHRITNAIVVFG